MRNGSARLYLVHRIKINSCLVARGSTMSLIKMSQSLYKINRGKYMYTAVRRLVFALATHEVRICSDVTSYTLSATALRWW